MAPYSSEILDTVRNIPPEEWDATIGVAGGVRHAMLTCYESGHPNAKDLRYILLRDDERLHAVCVAMSFGINNKTRLAQRILGPLADRWRFIRSCFRPALICGLLPGPGAPVLIRPESDTNVWMPRMIDVLEAYAAAQDLGLGFTEILLEQTSLVGELSRRGYYHAYGGVDTKIRITWEDEQTYLKMLRARSKNSYRVAKKELNKFGRSGISIAEWDGRNESLLYNLLKVHHEHRNAHPFALPPNFLSTLKGAIHDDCLVYVAQNEEKPVGVCVLLKQGQDACFWMVGIDHEADAKNFTYFNLSYYHVFRQAPTMGLRQIRYGNGALRAKTGRGCEAELTHFFYKPRAVWSILVLRILFPLQKLLYRRKFSPYLTAHPGGLRQARVSKRRDTSSS